MIIAGKTRINVALKEYSDFNAGYFYLGVE